MMCLDYPKNRCVGWARLLIKVVRYKPQLYWERSNPINAPLSRLSSMRVKTLVSSEPTRESIFAIWSRQGLRGWVWADIFHWVDFLIFYYKTLLGKGTFVFLFKSLSKALLIVWAASLGWTHRSRNRRRRAPQAGFVFSVNKRCITIIPYMLNRVDYNCCSDIIRLCEETKN